MGLSCSFLNRPSNVQIRTRNPQTNIHLPSRYEEWPESDAFLTYVALIFSLGALLDIVNCFQILPRGAILVSINDDPIWIDTKYNIEILPSDVLVVTHILEKFRNELRLAYVKILWKAYVRPKGPILIYFASSASSTSRHASWLTKESINQRALSWTSRVFWQSPRSLAEHSLFLLIWTLSLKRPRIER